MSASSDGLFGQSVAKYQDLYCDTYRLPRGSIEVNDRHFRDFLKELHATGKAFQSEEKPVETKTFNDHLTQLAPDWERRRRQGNVRMKTFLKIYLSKWFWQGLEWQELEFVHVLISRLPDPDLEWIRDNKQLLVNRKGFQVFLEESLKDDLLPLNQRGWNLLGMAILESYIYPETDFLAIWKLRTVQSLRDSMFRRVTGHEHEGKTGIKKARIRGYRDGKASPRDANLTRMAREVDRTFYEHEFEERWNQLEEELNRFMKT